MLNGLPVEVLIAVVAYIPTARDLASLSATSKRIHRIIEAEEEGWRVFVLTRFPSISTPPCWRQAAHALTTLSRNVDRRGFVASDVQPKNVLYITHGLRKPHHMKASKQTMGYQAVLDCYEDMTANSWSSRREVLAWGAGADLIVRRSERAKTRDNTESKDTRGPPRTQHQDWWVYQERLYREGLHDITSTDLIRPPHRHTSPTLDSSEEVLVGRANGDLDLIEVSARGRRVLRSFLTEGGAVRSSDIASERCNLLAAVTGNHSLGLFQLHGEDEAQTEPLSAIKSTLETDVFCRSWSVKFISDSRVAVGRGPSKDIVHVYPLTPAGLRQDAVRKFGRGGVNTDALTSAFPLAVLPESSADPGTASSCFWSGGYDGRIRLHDTRSPSDCEVTFTDPIEQWSVFSLATIGRERVIAGSSSNSLLKVFDLRMTGGRAYSYIDPSALRSSQSSTGAEYDATHEQNGRWVSESSGAINPSGFNVFAGKRPAPRNNNNNGRRDMTAMRQANSSIYSLVRPSACSSLLYIGLEDGVQCVNFSGMHDAHPDSVFMGSVSPSQPQQKHRRPWLQDGNSSPLCLALYEQQGGRSMKILTQEPYRRDAAEHKLAGYDERLRENNTDKALEVRGPRRGQRGW